VPSISFGYGKKINELPENNWLFGQKFQKYP